MASPIRSRLGNLVSMECVTRSTNTNRVLPTVTRREEEDSLTQRQYAEFLSPRASLVSLAHSLIARKVFDEDEWTSRMAEIRARLES